MAQCISFSCHCHEKHLTEAILSRRYLLWLTVSGDFSQSFKMEKTRQKGQLSLSWQVCAGKCLCTSWLIKK